MSTMQNESEQMYWDVSLYTTNTISLLKDDQKRIYSEKLDKKQVEQFLGRALKVCPAIENPEVIVSAYVIDKHGNKLIDQRKRRGRNVRYFIFKN